VEAHRARAALERELPFLGAHLTWSEDSQRFEDALHDALVDAGRDPAGLAELRARLDRVQAEIDAASLSIDEWNVLYRLRLQVEARAAAEGAGAARGADQRAKVSTAMPSTRMNPTSTISRRAPQFTRRVG
jgi:hypothetical protein